ncbi:MAG: VOC family protein [Thermoanaerobaculia bacterium]
MKAVNPYINFAGNTEEAFRFYQTVFGGELTIVRFKDFKQMEGMPPLSDGDKEKIGHISLPLGADNVLMGTDALESFGQQLNAGSNYSIALEADSIEEAEELFNKLSDGGQIGMPFGETEWAERFGGCTDKFGIQWMINYTGSVQFAAGHEG